MRIMYLAPRYHTNQSAIMKGWQQHGDEICFLSHYAGKSEDYSWVKPEIIGYSKLFRMIDYVYVNVIKRNDPYGGNWKLKCGFPPVGKLSYWIKKFNPDLVIVRERSVYSICMNLLCNRHHVPVILYNQSPLWDTPHTMDLKHKLVWKLVPRYRITPVLRKNMTDTNLVKEENAWFLPFVMEPQMAPDEKVYFRDGKINILSIGKYEVRKNHLMLIELIEKLADKYSVHLTIVGECSNHFHEDYLGKVRTYIAEHRLENLVTLHVNLRRENVFELYGTSDVFVLPSTDEPAAVSHLEAMAFALPAVCSTGNGTASYIVNGETGYIFKDNDKDDLEDKLQRLICSRDNIVKMGAASYMHVKNNFQFDNYYSQILKILERQSDYGNG
ncbi:MAG: glycosyltransferase family 4 protein [Lachnospiraceae bacterium]|nr:glycosyltransferase family 4 protein [Lachnospiraceae bacterium]